MEINAVHKLDDNLAIISVAERDDGKYLCFTDKDDAKLCIKVPRPVPEEHNIKRFAVVMDAFPDTCPCGCGCQYVVFFGERMLVIPGTWIPCPHH
jgi:hypothetical protein